MYVLLAHTPTADLKALRGLADQLGHDAGPHLEEVTGARWRFHVGKAHRLRDNDSRHASDFLRQAHLRMVQSPSDLVLVITDAALVSRADRLVPGLASPEGRVVVISAHELRTGRFGDPSRALDSDAVRWNAATLLVHLCGHLLGLDHRAGGVMAPFSFEAEHHGIPSFAPESSRYLVRAAERMPEPEVHTRGTWERLRVHVAAAARHPREVLAPAVRSRALLLPLRLTKMLAAALTPTFVLLFTDEFWWVGIERDPVYVWTAAAAAVLIGTWYVPSSQGLFFPQREKRIVTPHVALVNVAILVSSFFMMLGLFATVVLLILLVEWWFFPPGYMSEWFQDRGFDVSWLDRLHLAVVVSTLGTLTGALGGGFHGRGIIRHLELFYDEP